MVMRRQALRLRPVSSLKHIVDTTGAIIGAAQSVTDVIDTVQSPALGQPNQCSEGSTVSAIYLRVEAVVAVGASNIDNIYMAVFKNPANNLTLPPNVAALGSYDAKRYVIHQEMVMLGQPGGNPGSANIARTVFKGVIKLPRSFKRNGYDDKLQVLLQHTVGESTQDTSFCLECIYKEFR